MSTVDDPILSRSEHVLLDASQGEFVALVTDISSTVVEGELSVRIVEALTDPMPESVVVQEPVDRGWADAEQVSSARARL
jgi:hypothetical protein